MSNTQTLTPPNSGSKAGAVFRKQEEKGNLHVYKTPFISHRGSFFPGVQTFTEEVDHPESADLLQASFISPLQLSIEEEEIQREPEEIQDMPESGTKWEINGKSEQEQEVQRLCAECDEEEEVQRSPDDQEPEVLQKVEEIQPLSHGDDQNNLQQSAIPLSSPEGIQASLKVGAPDDPYEQEADQMAEQVMRMPERSFSDGEGILPIGNNPTIHRNEEDEADDIQAKLVQRVSGLQRSSNGTLQTTSGFTSHLQSSLGGGLPLSPPVRQSMESAFNADFSRVNIHTGSDASQLSNEIGAKAFTYQNHVFFNEGNYQPETSAGRSLLAHELTHTVQQGAAVRRSAISTNASPQVQRIPFGDTLNRFTRHIPGFTLFTIIIGYNPLTERTVDRNAINLIQGLMELIPVFGPLLFDELQRRGILHNAYTWVQQQLINLGLTRNSLEILLSEAIDHLKNPLNWPSAGDYLGNLFHRLWNQVNSFARNLVNHLIELVKNALIGVLRSMAIDRMPAYLLLTKILGRDPITGERVQATTVEILEDFLRLINADDELEQMRERGTLQKTADWIDTQIGQFMSLLDELGSILDRIWNLFTLETLRNITAKLEEIITAFTGFVRRVWNFASNVASQVLQFIKDSLLNMLRQHASGIRGYRLMTVILSKDPVTQEPVRRNANNILSGFVELVAGPEKFREIEESGAIVRMAAWLEGLIARTGISIQMVIDLFMGIWNSLSIQDLIRPIEAFQRVLARFQDPIERVLSFIVQVIRKVIEIILELMNFPSDLIGQIIQRAMVAIDDIQRDPVAFLKNLLGAIKLGFQQFFGNIGTHLLNGLTGWLFSELQQAGIQPPQDTSLRGIIGFVLDVLGISVERIWQKLAEHPRIGPERVARIRGMLDRLTGIWTFVQEVMTEGPGAIWRHLQEQLANLWTTLLDQVKNWITERVVNQIVGRLLSMLDPTGIMAIINSAVAFYRAVQSFVERLREILEVVNSFVGGIAEIARGSLATAANFLENTMGRAMPVMIGFLANQVGLRGLGQRIGEMVGSVRGMVDQGLTWLVNRAVQMGGQLLEMGRSGISFVVNWWSARKQFRTKDGQQHNLYFIGEGVNAQLIFASNPTEIGVYLINKRKSLPSEDPKLVKIAEAESILGRIEVIKRENVKKRKDAAKITDDLEQLSLLIIFIEGLKLTDNVLPQKFKADYPKYGSVSIEKLSTKSSTGGSIPTANPGWYQFLKSKNLTANSAPDRWVRMHLLSARIGGKGDDPQNLIPAPNSVNRGSKVGSFENALYNLVERENPNTRKPNVIWMNIVGGDLYSNDTSIPGYTADWFLKKIEMKAGIYFWNGTEWVKDSAIRVSEDVPIPEPDFSLSGNLTLANPSRTRLQRLDRGLFTDAVVNHMKDGQRMYNRWEEFVSAMRARVVEHIWAGKWDDGMGNGVIHEIKRYYDSDDIKLK